MSGSAAEVAKSSGAVEAWPEFPKTIYPDNRDRVIASAQLRKMTWVEAQHPIFTYRTAGAHLAQRVRSTAQFWLRAANITDIIKQRRNYFNALRPLL